MKEREPKLSNHMKKQFNFFYQFSLIFLILISSLACSSNDDPDPTPIEKQEDILSVDAKVEKFLLDHEIPGASLAISKNGKLVYQKAFGLQDVQSGKAMTPQTQMRVASVSKSFTGLAIMLLVQEGRINLDDKVFGDMGILGNSYGSKPYSARVSQVTVKHLLQMTSGGWVINGNRDAIDYQQTLTNESYFDWMLDNATLNFEPGSQYWYINSNYFVAARIVEKVSGKSYSQFVKESITDPLKMGSTVLAKNGLSGKQANEATYYGQGDTKGFEYNFNIERRDGDAGIVTTAVDLMKIVVAMDGNASKPDLLRSDFYNQFIQGSNPNQNFANGIAKSNQFKYFYGALPGTRSGYMFHSNGMAVTLIFNGNADYTKTNYSNFANAHDALMVELLTKDINVYQDIDQF